MIRKLLTRLTHKVEVIQVDEGIYPLTLAHGNYVTELDGETATWQNITPIINADLTITMFSNGQFVGHVAAYYSIGRE